jgi:hypothetical protein
MHDNLVVRVDLLIRNRDAHLQQALLRALT